LTDYGKDGLVPGKKIVGGCDELDMLLDGGSYWKELP